MDSDYPEIPRKQSKPVPEGNCPVSQYDEFGPDQPTLADMYLLFKERLARQLSRMKSHLDDLVKKVRETRQRLAGLEYGARKSRLTMEADVTPDTKTRKRTEDAAANRAKHGDKSSSAQVDPDPTYLASFGDDSTELPALPCRDDTMVDKGAEAPKPVSHPWRCRR